MIPQIECETCNKLRTTKWGWYCSIARQLIPNGYAMLNLSQLCDRPQPSQHRTRPFNNLLRSIGYYATHIKGATLVTHTIVKLLLGKPSTPVRIHTRYGFDLICTNPATDRGVERPLYLTGAYEAGTLGVMQRILNPGDVFIDAGANIGLMTLMASRLVGRTGAIYSFEPEPTTYAILQENIAINGVGNVQVFNLALGEHSHKAFIHTNPYAGRGSASLIKPSGVPHSIQYEVQVEPLDTFCAKHGIATPKMLKVDVEGWELHVLRGARTLLHSVSAPILCVEYDVTARLEDNKLDDIFNYVRAINKYRVFRLKRGKEIPSPLIEIKSEHDLPHHDNLFCLLPLHLETVPRNMFVHNSARGRSGFRK